MNEILKSLETHYVEGRFNEALELLEKSKGDIPVGQYHYNLGSLYAKLEELGPARYHLEKALDEGFVNAATLNNLEYAKTQLAVRDISTSTDLFDRLLSWFLEQPSEMFLALTLFFGFCFLLSFRFNGLRSTWLRYGFLFCSFAVFSFDKFYLGRLDAAVSLSVAPVREGPSEVYEQRYNLPAGAKVILGGSTNGWSLIKRPQELSGWVREERFGRL